ncbi:lytic transglycosylase domain-containing protein [Nocardioides massiliensis]|uniref:Membrane-bound lytic murein transglycosylase B n=1 Tax=Nocardioides massiliensis TaxID=1325935 RepID=A0ABT9NQS4_9ACTN|nr:lytic murein transglycosylase [Nocardioides massiliensis]MDP9822661.1 membrane-bound lytic murein transglycosylase B [Nocardioides massiliensis]
MGSNDRLLPALALVGVVVAVVIGVVLVVLGVHERSGPVTVPTAADVGGARPAPTPVAPAVPAPEARLDGPVPVELRADPAWVARVAEGAGIPPRALAAYAGAVLTVADDRPGCHLGWNTLAAIGHVESGHGSINGSRLLDDGMTSPRIRGIALDGNGVAAIRDTDGGELDGDPTWDRAVGPMQFIPSTWRTHGRDGDGDGEVRIDDIDDAALSAAYYLCHSGRDLRDSQAWIDAVASYNAGLAYNHSVVEAANYYRQFH